MKKRSEQEWRALFVRQTESGLSAARFCSANDLCAKHFSLRKKQLHQGESSSAFVPVTLTHARASATSTVESALVLHHGVSALYFDTTPNPEWLARLLRAVA